MANFMANLEQETKKTQEWLQLLEFIKRIYGEDKAELIRTNDYLKRNNKSVAEYYNITSVNPQNVTLSQLLKNPEFITKVISSSGTEEELTAFTKIYNETNALMKTLDASQDNIYIKCNPVDDNGNVIESSNNSVGTNLSSLNSMFNELASGLSPMFLYSSVGLQTFISVLLFIIIYYTGKYIFIDYPNKMIAKRI